MKLYQAAKALKDNAGTCAFVVGYSTALTFVAKSAYEDWGKPKQSHEQAPESIANSKYWRFPHR